MPNFPTSLDSLTNPDATKFLDTSGFELDVVISRIQDILEAIEAKVGTGGSSQVATSSTILGGGGAGVSLWRQIATTDLPANVVSQRWYVTPSATTTTAPPSWGLAASTTQTFGGGAVRMDAHLNVSNASACTVQFGVQVDSGSVTQIGVVTVASSVNVAVSVGFNFSTLAGSHAVKLLWNTTAGTIQTGTGCLMILEELKA